MAQALYGDDGELLGWFMTVAEHDGIVAEIEQTKTETQRLNECEPPQIVSDPPRPPDDKPRG